MLHDEVRLILSVEGRLSLGACRIGKENVVHSGNANTMDSRVVPAITLIIAQL